MNARLQSPALRNHVRSGTLDKRRRRPVINSELLLLLVSVYFSLFSNGAFWRNVIVAPAVQWRFALALFVLITALHALLLGLFVPRRYERWSLAGLILVTAFATHYMSSYGIYLDADMMRNVLHTDSRESTDLLGWSLLFPPLFASFPIALLWQVDLRPCTWRRAVLSRLAFLFLMALTIVMAAWSCSQDLSSLIRNRREVRYLVTPANYLVSLVHVATTSASSGLKVRSPIGQDARQIPASTGRRPRLLVLVVGETVRAANWGLNGYARQTTPELARWNVINFPDVTSCGSSTEVSLPCMFSPYGRHDYDEKAIRGHQSLLHVLEHAGIPTLWRDNQSGCKGVCDGLAMQSLTDQKNSLLCNGKRCLDEILLDGFDRAIPAGKGDRVIVLHGLGNHGPNYFERYPAEFRRYTPVCESSELGDCDRDSIINAYDNALLYTDHVLARTLAMLASNTRYDTAMIYLSDHGESLGEKGLYLHGVPYAIAPAEQTRIPMVMWFSPGFTDNAGLDTACLRREATNPASQDNLFPSVLGLMDVSTELYEPKRDLFAPCRNRGLR